MDTKVKDLGDAIMRSLDQFPSGSLQKEKIRLHLGALLEAMDTTSDYAKPEYNQPPSRTQPPQQQQPKRKTSGMWTGRRYARKAAGLTLAQVAAEANCAVPTVRLFELKPTTVRPDKRAALESVYSRFPRVRVI